MSGGSSGKAPQTAAYVTAKHVQETYGVSRSTLVQYAEEGKIDVVRLGPGGKRLYSIASVRAFLGQDRADLSAVERRVQRVVYARVSSAKQKACGDLQRQVDVLRGKYPHHEVITDVASGINFKRKGLLSILDRAHAGVLAEVVVAHRDRLCRFAVDLVEHVLTQAGVRLVVLDKSLEADTAPTDPAAELAEDLLAITTVFVARHNGLRSAAHRRERKRKRAEGDKGEGEGGGGAVAKARAQERERERSPADEGAEDSSLSDEPPAKRPAAVDGRVPVDV
jgi:putative resolvase